MVTVFHKSKFSSSINLFRYGYYVLTGLVLGLGEPVLYHKDLLVVVVGGE